jgi:hypothetical protein
MIGTRSSGEEPGTARVRRTGGEVARPGAGLRATLWWVPPATAMLTGAWIAATVLGRTDGLLGLPGVLTCAAAATVAAFGGMSLFERVFGAPGAALGAGAAVQLIQTPLVQAGLVPPWWVPVGWALTLLAAGVLAWRAHTRRPPVICTAEPLVTSRGALDELVGIRSGSPERVVVSGRFGLSGWPRTALQAVELAGNPPAEIDAVVSIETPARRGTAFLVAHDGTHAELVTNDHVIDTATTARVSIAGTVRDAAVLPHPDREQVAERLAEHIPHLDAAQRRRLAQDADLRLVRIEASGLPVTPLQLATTDTADALALSVGYPHGGIPRFVWPASPVPLPVVGVGRLRLGPADAQLWTPWRIQSGNSGGPVLVCEHGRLRVAAVTHLQHETRRSRGDAPHIPVTVLRAYLAAARTTAAGTAADGGRDGAVSCRRRR